MVWQDSDEEIKIAPPSETEYREEDYSPLGPKKRSLGKIFQVPDWPFRWIAAGLAVLVLLALWAFSGSDAQVPSQKLAALEKQIAQLESRLAKLAPQINQDAGGGSENQKIAQYMGRFDRFEVATTKRMDDLTQRLDNLSKRIANASTAVNPPSAKSASSKSEPRYHLVSKGETLYSISRAYGLSLGELRRLNGLDDKTAIYPGQKLKIK